MAPLYEYRCPDDHEFSEFRSISERNTPALCMECGKISDRILSPVRHEILFRPGYYNTVGSHCETEMEYHNKYSKAVDKVVEHRYSDKGKKSQEGE